MSDAAAMLRDSLRLSLGWWGRKLLGGVAILIALYLLIPIALIFPMSLTGSSVLTWPPELVSGRWFSAFFESAIWTEALIKSLRIAIPVAAAATVIGTLGAIGVTYAHRGRRVLQTLFIAPLVLPIITYALGVFDVAQRFGLNGSVWPLIIGQMTLATPLVFIVVSSGLANRDPLLPKAAASLGASARSVLWRIELPLLRPTIVAAALIAFAYSFDEIIVAYYLSPPGGGTLPVQILQSTREAADPTIAAASMVVIAVAASIGALVLLVRALVMRRFR